MSKKRLQLIREFSNFMYSGDHDSNVWAATPIFKHRDSCLMERTNFDGILKELGDQVGEEGPFDVLHSSHWGCGWVDQLIVDTSNEGAIERLKGIVGFLEAYPVWDDEAYSEARSEAERKEYGDWMILDLRNMWVEDPENKDDEGVAEFLEELDADNTWAAYRIAMDSTDQYYDEDGGFDLNRLYPVWRDVVKSGLHERATKAFRERQSALNFGEGER